MKIVAPHYLFNPTLPNGDANPLFGLVVWASTRGVKVEKGGDTSHLCLTDTSDVTLEHVFGIVQAGGEVEGYPVFLEMTNTAYGKDVPAGISNRSYTDEDDNEVIRKWSEWKDTTHEHVKIGTKNYVPGNSFGVELKGSELGAIYSLTGVNILTPAEYVAKLPVPDDV